MSSICDIVGGQLTSKFNVKVVIIYGVPAEVHGFELKYIDPVLGKIKSRPMCLPLLFSKMNCIESRPVNRSADINIFVLLEKVVYK